MPTDLVERLEKVGAVSKQTVSAVARASTTLGLEFLEAHPDWIGPIDGGSLSEPSVRSYLIRAMAEFAESKHPTKTGLAELVSSQGQSEKAIRSILETQVTEWRPELFKAMAANVKPALESILKPYLADIFSEDTKRAFQRQYAELVAKPGASPQAILDAAASNAAEELEKFVFSGDIADQALDKRRGASKKRTKPKASASKPAPKPPKPKP